MTDGFAPIIADALAGRRIAEADALHLAECRDTRALTEAAQRLTLGHHGARVSYSRKVFIPLTRLCRDVCAYCTFARAPSKEAPHYLSPDDVLAIARAGAAAGCKEALFTLGDQPEARYAAARTALAELGFATTLDYLEAMAALVLKETGLLPHLNPGVLDETWLRRLRAVSVSQGMMLETTSERLSQKGGPHYGSPDKAPAVRLAVLEAAGRAKVPFTTGLLIGIGETRRERIEALLAIRSAHERHGHIQEVIIQNFRAKSDTRMAAASEPDLDDHVWTIAMARLLLGSVTVQAPPNLQPGALEALVEAGINDWGGVSPVTPDHVNPEAPWPHLEALRAATERAGRSLVERLALYPSYRPQISVPEGPPEGRRAKAQLASPWVDGKVLPALLKLSDGAGLAREDGWTAGALAELPRRCVAAIEGTATPTGVSAPIAAAIDRIESGQTLAEAEVAALFDARGADFAALCQAADRLRQRRVGDTVTYVVNRNINYTNVCTYGCGFCAFSKGRHSLGNREKPYDLALEEIAQRTREAWLRGGSEVCLQGGIKPGYTGETYLAIARTVKSVSPDMHVHAFSPLEITHGAETLGLPLKEYLLRLKDAGLSSLPGTAAEILDDEVRAVLCPDKITTEQWFAVMEAAHAVGLKSTATIMFGHVDGYRHWARHLLRIRRQQERTGGFTELVPLAFVPMEAPIYLKGRARRGPTFREAILMHAVGRLVLDPVIANIQASWVKLGPEGAALTLDAGANDMGGVLMDESITRAAGAAHGQEVSASDMQALILARGRIPRQRSTAYGAPPAGCPSPAPAEAGPRIERLPQTIAHGIGERAR
ncbi:MAG: 5-amino-6-(D-ribitylamino)uracil--L-tyrosine 4-hydroxyphenyl transferase CofH [Hyphomicrobiaceae bacterium]|nr:5-amino-6-(D-ribitylamino)uracil--L-tyrosine 4-hydroxyphenyl transferase CofH [Hyphomicrobiaceae bacterium]